MSGVKRWEAEDNAYAHDEGEFVKFDDYDRDTQALRAEIERYIQEGIKIADQRDELRAQLQVMRAALDDAHWCMHLSPSCQSGIAERCRCKRCVVLRINAALEAKP